MHREWWFWIFMPFCTEPCGMGQGWFICKTVSLKLASSNPLRKSCLWTGASSSSWACGRVVAGISADRTPRTAVALCAKEKVELVFCQVWLTRGISSQRGSFLFLCPLWLMLLFQTFSAFSQGRWYRLSEERVPDYFLVLLWLPLAEKGTLRPICSWCSSPWSVGRSLPSLLLNFDVLLSFCSILGLR